MDGLACLFNASGLSGKRRLFGRQIVAREKSGVGGNEAAGLQMYDISGN